MLMVSHFPFSALIYAKVTLYDGHRVIKAKKTRPLVRRECSLPSVSNMLIQYE